MNRQTKITAPIRQFVLGRAQKGDESQISQLIFTVLAEHDVNVADVSLQEMKELLVDAVRATRRAGQFHAA